MHFFTFIPSRPYKNDFARGESIAWKSKKYLGECDRLTWTKNSFPKHPAIKIQAIYVTFHDEIKVKRANLFYYTFYLIADG